jgi:hypothetical protein
MKSTFVSSLLWSLLALSSSAATAVWDGGDALSDSWGSANNWNPNALPDPGDALVFPAGLAVGDRAAANSFTAGTSFASMRIEEIGYSITGNSWTVTQFIELNAGQGSSSVNTPLTLGASPVEFRCAGSRTVLNFGGAIALAGRVLELEASPGSLKFTGNVTDSGVGSIVKNGSGEAEFAASSTVTSSLGITVNAGRLVMNGLNSEGIDVQPGGTLNGTGISGGLLVSGTMSPGGNSSFNRGTFTCNGTVDFAAGSTFTVDLGNAGETSDQLSVAGTVTLASGAQLAVTLPSPLRLKPGDSFTILRKSNAGAISGQFANAPDGGSLTVGRVVFDVTYSGETGNDLVLTVEEVLRSGVTRTWDGGGNNDLWSTAANWVGDIAPESGDSLVFPAGAARPNPVNDFAADTPLADLWIGSGAYQIAGNRIRWIGNMTTSPSDTDLVFALPLLIDSSFLENGGGLVHSGSRRLTLTGALAGSESTSMILRQEAGAGGVTITSTLVLPMTVLASVNHAVEPIRWTPAATSEAQALLVLGGNQEFGGIGLFTTDYLSVGYVDPVFGGVFGAFPPTVLDLSGAAKQASNVIVAAGESIRSAAGVTMQLLADTIDFKGAATITTGAGGLFQFRVLGVSAAAGAQVVIDAQMIVEDPGFSFTLGTGAVCAVEELVSPASLQTGILTGGGRLSVGPTSQVVSLVVTGNSTLHLNGTNSGGTDLDVQLGSAGTPGHLTGSGRCGDLAATVFGSSVAPGSEAAPYARITCDFFASANVSLNLQVAGTVPAVSLDQLVILQQAVYNGAYLPNLTFVNGYAPQPLEELVVVAHGAGAQISGLGIGALQAIIYGQKWLIYSAGGDGNDLAFQKRVSELPATSGAGLPPPNLVVLNAATGAAVFEQFARGIQGITYVVEASDNLVQWTEVQRVSTTFGNPLILDSVPAVFGFSQAVNVQTQPRRFFRLRPL